MLWVEYWQLLLPRARGNVRMPTLVWRQSHRDGFVTLLGTEAGYIAARQQFQDWYDNVDSDSVLDEAALHFFDAVLESAIRDLQQSAADEASVGEESDDVDVDDVLMSEVDIQPAYEPTG